MSTIFTNSSHMLYPESRDHVTANAAAVSAVPRLPGVAALFVVKRARSAPAFALFA
jgi:hypothetical protein